MKWWSTAAKYVGIGWYIGGCIALGTGLGIWADRALHSKFPLLTLVGLFLGLFLAFWGVYQLLLPIFKQGNGEDKDGE